MSLFRGPQFALMTCALLFGAAMVTMLYSTKSLTSGRMQSTRETVNRGTMILAILCALILAFMTSHLKTSFDAADSDVRRFSGHLVDLDRTLRRAGVVSEPARETLFRYSARTMKDLWPESHPKLRPDDTNAGRLLQQLEDQIEAVARADRPVGEDAKRALVAVQATRIELDAHYGGSLSPWQLGFLLIWLTLTFGGIGMSAPRTPLAITAIFLLSVALGSAMFVASEYDTPFDGTIVVSTEPVENALFAMTE